MSGEKAEVVEVAMGKFYCRIYQDDWVGPFGGILAGNFRNLRDSGFRRRARVCGTVRKSSVAARLFNCEQLFR